MNAKININIFSNNQLIFTGETIAINLRADRFAFLTILPNHVPLLTDLADSKIHLKLNKNASKTFAVNRGVFYFANNKARIIGEEINSVNN